MDGHFVMRVGGTIRDGGPPSVFGQAVGGASELDIERVLQPLGGIAERFCRFA